MYVIRTLFIQECKTKIFGMNFMFNFIVIQESESAGELIREPPFVISEMWKGKQACRAKNSNV